MTVRRAGPSLGRERRCHTRNSGSGSTDKRSDGREVQDQKERVTLRAGNNRMTQIPDRYFAPAPAPALRDSAVLFELLEGPHEANARQRNSRRRVARSTG
jgi:hypothetical protein